MRWHCRVLLATDKSLYIGRRRRRRAVSQARESIYRAHNIIAEAVAMGEKTHGQGSRSSGKNEASRLHLSFSFQVA